MNHQAITSVVTEVIPIPGADNIHIARVLGENVIVSKDVGVGYIGILFPADLQLSEEFCFENNLNRNSELNKDNTKSGFFDANRKVRVQPFLKIRSQAYFCGLSSLSYTGEFEATIGFSFTEINNHKICQKYISEAAKLEIAKQNRPYQEKKNFAPYFAKHTDSMQFKHNLHMIPVGSLLSFHAKVHGTSHRSALTKVIIELPKWKIFVNKYFPIFPTEKFDYVVGSRNVVLTNKGKEGFHGTQQFRFDVASFLQPYMVNGMTVYGEIAGFCNGRSIMQTHSTKSTKDKSFQKKYGELVTYKYGCKDNEYRFHVYRISYLTHNGINVDFSQKQLEQWCKDRNILHTLEVSPQEIYDGDIEKLMKKVEHLTERPDFLCEDYIDNTHPSEGIVIRVDTGNLTPIFMKSKAYYFRTMEGLCDAIDTEDIS